MPRKRKPGRPRMHHGGNLRDIFRKAHDFVKSHKIISRAATALGNAGIPHAGRIGEVASTLGYGRRKIRHRRIRHRR